MRRALLLAGVATLALAGVAYAATTVTPRYILHGRLTPKRSGTPAHPVTVSGQLGWTVKTTPPGQRPPVVRGYHFYLQGLRANTNEFPACSTSKLNSTGPSGCARGSQIGTGELMVEVGPSSSTAITLTCRADVKLYNGGASTVVFYVYRGTEADACALPPPGFYTIVARLSRAHHGRDLVVNYSVPTAVRHPAPGLDAAVVSSTVTIDREQTTVKKRIGRRTRRERVGLLESVFCPHNHQRTLIGTFTSEDGHSRTSNAHIACT